MASASASGWGLERERFVGARSRKAAAARTARPTAGKAEISKSEFGGGLLLDDLLDEAHEPPLVEMGHAFGHFVKWNPDHFVDFPDLRHRSARTVAHEIEMHDFAVL